MMGSGMSLGVLGDKAVMLGVFVVVLGALIFVHELGHFLVAKFFRVGVLEFALGFGRKIFSFNRGETTYSVRLIPLGGFVRMTGDDPRLLSGEAVRQQEAGGASPIEGSQELTPAQQKMLLDQSRWFLKKPYLPRCAIVFAGPLFNFIFAWVLAFSIFATQGIPKFQDGPVTIGKVAPDLPANRAGLQPGDKVLTVDGKPIPTFKDLVGIVEGSEGKELAFEVERVAKPNPESPDLQPVPERLVLSVQPTKEAPELEVLAGKAAFRVGIEPERILEGYVPVSLSAAAKLGALQVKGLVELNLRLLKGLVTRNLSASKSIGGPGTIFKEIERSAQSGFWDVIALMVFLNVTLGIMNLLPIPVLDGGHLTLFTLEKLKGSPLNPRFTEYATQAGLLILMMLMIFAIGMDVKRFVGL